MLPALSSRITFAADGTSLARRSDVMPDTCTSTSSAALSISLAANVFKPRASALTFTTIPSTLVSTVACTAVPIASDFTEARSDSTASTRAPSPLPMVALMAPPPVLLAAMVASTPMPDTVNAFGAGSDSALIVMAASTGAATVTPDSATNAGRMARIVTVAPLER